MKKETIPAVLYIAQKLTLQRNEKWPLVTPDPFDQTKNNHHQRTFSVLIVASNISRFMSPDSEQITATHNRVTHHLTNDMFAVM
jgi:hypothetical protein